MTLNTKEKELIHSLMVDNASLKQHNAGNENQLREYEKMGFIHKEKVRVHKSKAGKISLAYDFINKNNEKDTMYIDIPRGWEIIKK